MQQTFPVGQEPRVSLGKVSGDLQVRGWDQREISIDWDGEAGDVHREGDVLILAKCDGNVELMVPYDTEVRVEGSLAGEVEASGIRRIELKNVAGDVELENIGGDAELENIGEAVLITDMGGDLSVRKASSVRTRKKIGGDADLEDVPLVELETVGGDLELREVEMASIGVIGGDLSASDLDEALRCGSIGGDCQISSGKEAEINLGNVGGDLEIESAALAQLGNVGGDAEIHDVKGDVRVGNIGGDAEISGVGGGLSLGRVGGEADLSDLANSIRVGGVGGDLKLEAAFPPASHTHLHVGGDAEVSLPANANLALQATTGGSVSGPSLSSSGGHGSLVRLVYGEGAAQVNLSVGGDLELRGGGSPRASSSANMPWGEFGKEMGEFGRQMGELGKEMGEMGKELGREFGGMFADAGASWVQDFTRKWEEQARKNTRKTEQNVRKAEERARQAAERARRAGERAGHRAERIHIRVNEREWQMNPERLNDLVARAQQAAMEGVAGALEAVERAVGNLRTPHPPMPPMPPIPPIPPMPPMPPFSFPGQSQSQSVPSQPEFGAEEEPEEERNLEQEHEAILRMIAEGRITPEEGDMLLEGLGG